MKYLRLVISVSILISFILCPVLGFSQEEFVAKLFTPDGGTGSCVVIEKTNVTDQGYDGLVVTAHHMVYSEKTKIVYKNVKIEYQNGRTCSSAFPVFLDPDNDMAIVRTWVPTDHPVCNLSEDPDGELCMVGYPFGKLKQAKGNFLRLFVAPETSTLYSDIPCNPGYSGGGLFKGKDLVGVVSGGWFWYNTEVGGKTELTTWPLKTCSMAPVIKYLKSR